ncbi:MAG TPA: phosphatase PAP2 family protein [Ktedonobacteraceae bacterium]|nr:phosphatase PAP2 family protein [Ktedonobacteraceae bacterium]
MQQKQSDQDQKNANENAADSTTIGGKIGEGTHEVVEEAKQGVSEARRPWYQIVKWGRILIAIYVILFVLFGLLAWWVYYHPVIAIDVTITREFQENQSPWLRNFMVAVSYIGNTSLVALGVIILAMVLLWIVDLRLEAIMVAAVSAVSSILNWLIKLIVDRPRPSSSLVDVIQHAGGNSFPSGHVMSYVAFWGLLFTFGIILFKGNHWWRTALLIISGLFVVLVGPSRIYLGDHWATDVLGAYLIGGLLLGVSLWIYLFLKERGVLAPRNSWARSFREKYLK